MKWIEYTGDNKQIEEINRSESFLLKRKDGKISFALHPPLVMSEMDNEVTTHYLIGKPHPYADLIKIWADTGCPVWVRLLPYSLALLPTGSYKIVSSKLNKGIYTEHTITTNTPYWDIPGAEYRLTPFED